MLMQLQFKGGWQSFDKVGIKLVGKLCVCVPSATQQDDCVDFATFVICVPVNFHMSRFLLKFDVSWLKSVFLKSHIVTFKNIRN